MRRPGPSRCWSCPPSRRRRSPALCRPPPRRPSRRSATSGRSCSRATATRSPSGGRRARATWPARCAAAAPWWPTTTGPTIRRCPTCSRSSAGRTPTAKTRASCPRFDCVYGPEVATLPGQLEFTGRTWKGYLEDLPAECTLPAPGIGDPFRKASASRSTSRARTRSPTSARSPTTASAAGPTWSPLSQLRTDLAAVETTPAWSLDRPGHLPRRAGSRPAPIPPGRRATRASTPSCATGRRAS